MQVWYVVWQTYLELIPELEFVWWIGLEEITCGFHVEMMQELFQYNGQAGLHCSEEAVVRM